MLILSQYYPPETADRIPHSLAHGLRERGHRVAVVTGFPNYPNGRLFEGYRQRLRHVERDGDLLVRRVPLVVSHSTSAFGRVANYLSFGVSALLASRQARSSDVVYVYATQMTAAIAPGIWRRVWGTPYVLHIQDLWPESITDSSLVSRAWQKRLLSRVLDPWLQRMYRHAAAVVAIAPTMRDMLLERGADPRTTHAVFNWANETDLAAVTPLAQRADGDGLVLTYAGNLGDMQDLTTAVDAAALLEDLPDFRLNLVGAGVAESALRERVETAGTACIVFRGTVPPAQMAEIYSESDFQLVPLRDLEIFRGTVPSKLQNSLAHGVPVITSVAGDTSRVVEAHALGLTALPEDAKSLADAIRRAYSLSEAERAELADNARRFYAEQMSLARGVDAFDRILREAATTRGGKP